MYFGTYDSFNSETNDNKTSFLIDINGGFLGLLQLALVFQAWVSYHYDHYQMTFFYVEGL